jgi:5-methylcytosine-specific restriction endonuclease McrA
VVLAQEVDHITPPRGAMHLMRDPNNLQSLCKSHHGRKTRGKTVIGTGLDGWYPVINWNPMGPSSFAKAQQF